MGVFGIMLFFVVALQPAFYIVLVFHFVVEQFLSHVFAYVVERGWVVLPCMRGL